MAFEGFQRHQGFVARQAFALALNKVFQLSQGWGSGLKERLELLGQLGRRVEAPSLDLQNLPPLDRPMDCPVHSAGQTGVLLLRRGRRPEKDQPFRALSPAKTLPLIGPKPDGSEMRPRET